MLSVITLLKKEAPYARLALDRARELGGELIIFLDRTADPATVDFASRYANKVVSGDWRGFAAAFNQALEEAKGHWILRLDSDELLDAKSIAELHRLCSEDRSAIYSLPRYNYGRRAITCAHHERLFRNHRQLRYTLRLWEQIDWRARAELNYSSEAGRIVLHHLSHLRSDYRAKQRYLLVYHRQLRKALRSGMIEAPTSALYLCDWHIATSSAALGQFDEARNICEAAIGNDLPLPWLEFFLSLSADLALWTGSPQRALPLLTRLLDLGKEDAAVSARTMNGLCITSYLLGKYAEAQSWIEKAVEQGSHMWHLHVNEGLLAENRGDFEAAQASFLRALETAADVPVIEAQVGTSETGVVSHVLPTYQGLATHLRGRPTSPECP